MVLCRSLCLFIGRSLYSSDGSLDVSVCLSEGLIVSLSVLASMIKLMASCPSCPTKAGRAPFLCLCGCVIVCLFGCVSVCLLVCLCKYDRVGVGGGQPKFSN